MKTLALCTVLLAALAAGCDQTSTESKAPPPNASSGATGSGGVTTGPTGERMGLPPAPGGTTAAETKPDPGDANDHSNPQHDAKTDKGSGS